MSANPPALPLALLRRLLPRAEREEVLADVQAEYAATVEHHGRPAANRWLWQQAVQSAPSLLKWNWWRGVNGFEPPANNYRAGGPMLKYLWSDIRIAARRLKSRPSYSLLAIITLALGIGGTTAVFGVARPLVFDPLPYANEKETVRFWFSGSWTEQEFAHLRGRIPGYRSVAFYRQSDATLRDDGAPARLLPGIAASSELFEVLGAQPMLGTGFRKGDDAQGAEPVAVISYGVWQELGASASIIGSRVTLDGVPRTVIGVMPRGFWFPTPAVRLWTPQAINPENQNGSFTLLGHVSPGQDPSRMEGHTAALVKMLRERFTYSSDWDKTKEPGVTPIREALLGNLRPALVATFVAMGLILLIACTNVAALLLGQLESRAPELAVRTALGANRRRLAQPLLVEALLLGLASGIVGAAVAATGFDTLARALPLGAFGESATFDWSLFVVAMSFALIAVLLVVLVPSASIFRREHGDLQGVLSQARTGGVRGGVRMERVLVVAEVALAMLIASGAGLLVRSVTNLYGVRPGFTTEGVAVVDVVVSGGTPLAQRRAALNELAEKYASMPGVASASYAMKLPLRGGGNSFGITIEGQPAASSTTTFFRMVSRDYLRTMGMTLTKGRWFEASDRPDSTESLVVINESLAKKYFPGVDPIGRRVGGGLRAPQRIIGVVADVKEGQLLDEMLPTRYYLTTQVWFGNNASFVVKMQRPEQAEGMLDQLRKTANTQTPLLAVERTTTMQRVLDLAVGPARQIMTLLTILSGLALLLGAVGIYGVMSHFATRRKRDWAIRVALGLPGTRVISHIVGHGAALVGLGVVAGGIATMSTSRLLSSMLFNVSGVDALAFTGAALAVLTAGLVAALIPARRAGRVDP
ncbi:MAG: ABC transporter permease, partial [Phycisphaerae bacterium]|nr:ABC transporter permease [Gemmatimonadaceae bacterium]